MTFLDKFKFWKHEEPLPEFGDFEAAFPTGGGPPFGAEGPHSPAHDEFGSLSPASQPVSITPAQAPYQIVQPQPIYQPVQPPMNKEMEILSLKLDTIKNTLDTINMRLERLEQLARREEYPTKQGRF